VRRVIRIAKRTVLYGIAILVGFLVISLILTWITVHDYDPKDIHSQHIYLHTNGVHLDMVIPVEFMQDDLKNGLMNPTHSNYVSFGWGDEKFYLDTPSWSDLTFKTAATAMFFKSSTLMHVTSYSTVYADWVKIYVSEEEMSALQHQINSSFKYNSQQEKILLKDKGYSANDEFYRAEGSYSILFTCNSWVNSIFKNSDLKSCVWTPFDFGLMWKYE